MRITKNEDGFVTFGYEGDTPYAEVLLYWYLTAERPCKVTKAVYKRNKRAARMINKLLVKGTMRKGGILTTNWSGFTLGAPDNAQTSP